MIEIEKTECLPLLGDRPIGDPGKEQPQEGQGQLREIEITEITTEGQQIIGVILLETGEDLVKTYPKNTSRLDIHIQENSFIYLFLVTFLS